MSMGRESARVRALPAHTAHTVQWASTHRMNQPYVYARHTRRQHVDMDHDSSKPSPVSVFPRSSGEARDVARRAMGGGQRRHQGCPVGGRWWWSEPSSAASSIVLVPSGPFNFCFPIVLSTKRTSSVSPSFTSSLQKCQDRAFALHCFHREDRCCV